MIPYGRHSIEQDDIDAVVGALKSDWLTTGPLVEEFEKSLSHVAGAECVSVSSGTAALHCAYAAIGVTHGDEIITPPITFVATQATAALMGAKIVFADVQHDTGNIDPLKVEQAINSHTKAIVAVDYAGHPADMDELRIIADKYGVFLIEDSAHSIGSTYKGRPVGSLADLTTFSFFPTKNMTTAEGGAVASPDKELINKARLFSRQGLIREKDMFKIRSEGSWHQEVHEFGLNYRLPDVLCALGNSQLAKLESFKEIRRSNYARYFEAFQNINGLVLPVERDYVSSNWHLFPVRVPSERRLQIFGMLRNAGIGVQVNYLPAYRHPAFSGLNVDPRNYPNSESYYKSEISLPMHVSISEYDFDYICTTLIEILAS
jgi:dTDP-4-amino-4,6-dideoxygalactose transaminase